MFTLDDIKPLVLVPGAKAVIIKKKPGLEIDDEMAVIIEKQIKKATKLPVIWVPYNLDITSTVEEING